MQYAVLAMSRGELYPLIRMNQYSSLSELTSLLDDRRDWRPAFGKEQLMQEIVSVLSAESKQIYKYIIIYMHINVDRFNFTNFHLLAISFF